MKTYRVNEIFYSIQGEGVHAGEPMLFLRFAGCNMKCSREREGFDCDTKHEGGEEMTAGAIHRALRDTSPKCTQILLTGGEPLVQLDLNLLRLLHGTGYTMFIETNGTIEIPQIWRGSGWLSWVAVSPKRHSVIRITKADEIRIVLPTSTIPRVPRKLQAAILTLSPVFHGQEVDRDSLDWCIKWCLSHPEWRLSVQQHKEWRIA